MENLRTESFNGKLYTTNNDSFTNSHNKIMNELLWSYSRYFYDDINYNYDFGVYWPLNEEGAEVLEHLLNCDLISVVAD